MGRLGRFAGDWNRFGKRNPFGAILTGEAGALPQWKIDAFFATGRDDAERFLANLTRLAPDTPRGRALDFGCGVGRVTRALGERFERVTGADVAVSMVKRARELNHDRPNCRFIVTPQAHLNTIDTASFDVIYCRLVLQHVPPAYLFGYLPELVRVLAPGGVLMFQLPDEIAPEAEDAFADAPVVGGGVKTLLPRPLVRACRLVKYRLIVDESNPTMAMFGMAKQTVLSLLTDAGGTIIAVEPDQSHGTDIPGYEYWVTRPVQTG